MHEANENAPCTHPRYCALNIATASLRYHGSRRENKAIHSLVQTSFRSFHEYNPSSRTKKLPFQLIVNWCIRRQFVRFPACHLWSCELARAKEKNSRSWHCHGRFWSWVEMTNPQSVRRAKSWLRSGDMMDRCRCRSGSSMIRSVPLGAVKTFPAIIRAFLSPSDSSAALYSGPRTCLPLRARFRGY